MKFSRWKYIYRYIHIYFYTLILQFFVDCKLILTPRLTRSPRNVREKKKTVVQSIRFALRDAGASRDQRAKKVHGLEGGGGWGGRGNNVK